MAVIKCGKCKILSDAEEVTPLVYYRCKNCGALNEIFDIPLRDWLGFNYNEYKLFINQFLRGYQFEDILALNKIELTAGRLSQQQVGKLRKILQGGFAQELSLKEIAEDIERLVKPKDLFRMKDGKILKGKTGQNLLAISAARRPISLARTETTRAGAEGSILHYKDGGVEKVRFVASLGKRTCPICLDLNGSVFTLQDSGGVIPVHGMCRCTFIPISETTASISGIGNFMSYKNG